MSRSSTFSRRHFVTQLASIVLLLATSCVATRTVYDEISSNPDLSKFKELVERDEILVLLMKKRAVTVFAPTNQAIQAYLDRNPGPNSLSSNLANYHAANGAIRRNQFPLTVNSMQGQSAPLFMSVSPYGPNSFSSAAVTASHLSGDDKFFYINNALVLEAHESDLSADNSPQVLYVIDEVLTLYQPTALLPPNALEFIQDPNSFGLGDLDLSNFRNHIKSNKLESIFSQPGMNTFFVPSKRPLPGAPEFDEYVVKAHVIHNDALFLRTMGDKHNYHTLAFDGTVDVELCLINRTSRFSTEKIYFVQTNTVKNDAAHKAGKVLSRLTLANIPVQNGVVHIIDKPLMLMDMSVRDFLRNQSKLSRFFKLLEKHPDIMNEINKSQNKTVLAPDDNAFENLINNNQNFTDIDESSDEIKKLLRQHVVFHSISSSDLKNNGSHVVYKSASGVPVEFRLAGTEPHTRLTVESGGVNATSIQSDFGASDGILHIIDRVLGMPFKTMREKLRAQQLLKETFKIGTQGGTQNWNGKLADENKRFTFFAPSDQAWVMFKQENPSEFKQLDSELYPPISRAILDRHLSAKGQFNRKDLLQTVKKVDTIQGELIISPDPTTREIFVEWEGKRAKIIQSDIFGLNGVIHVIDQVLAKKRDFRVNSAPTLYCHHHHTLLLIISGLLTTLRLFH